MKRTHLLIGLSLVGLLIGGFILKSLQNPAWVDELIEEKKVIPVENPPASIVRCEYYEQTVFLLPSRCCDIPSVLFNETGDFLCSPGGGITGIGDGRCPDYFEERESCKVVWEDPRSNL